MSEKGVNRQEIEKIAREIFHMEDEEQIDGLVNMMVYYLMYA